MLNAVISISIFTMVSLFIRENEIPNDTILYNKIKITAVKFSHLNNNPAIKSQVKFTVSDMIT